jgi:hypothetical protein
LSDSNTTTTTPHPNPSLSSFYEYIYWNLKIDFVLDSYSLSFSFIMLDLLSTKLSYW